MKEKTIVIDKFLGLNEDTTSGLDIKTGELSVCKNVRITENYKLNKRNGYENIIDLNNDKPIQNTWFGEINGKNILLVVHNGKVFEFDESELI